MDNYSHPAPGAPGRSPSWTSGAKTGIGRALNPGSEVTFNIGNGILNEVYFPREDIACIRECGLIVADGKDFLSFENKEARHKVHMVKPGIPLYQVRTNCIQKKYRISKEFLADPARNTVLQHIRFEPAKKLRDPLSIYIYLIPHLANQGSDNEAWLDDYKGMPILLARHGNLALAIASSTGWQERTVGFSGVSDAITDLRQNNALTKRYDYAGKGNVLLCAAPDLRQQECTIAIGFGLDVSDAAHQARSSLMRGYRQIRQQYTLEWEQWQNALRRKNKGHRGKAKYLRESAAALRISESRRYPGGIIASLSIPWGNARGDYNGLGYHLVWPRDLVESAGGFLALRSEEDALRILNYLLTIQDTDGKWSQNYWLDGTPGRTGLQMDQTALPILLLDICFRQKLLKDDTLRHYLPSLFKATAFILAHGPYTDQDRWEQQKGFSPFTMASQISALLAAAEIFQGLGHKKEALYCLQTADSWNGLIEPLTYVSDTPYARAIGVEGYYVRINPWYEPAMKVKDRTIHITHHHDGEGNMVLQDLVSMDALALVRFGLRRPDDPRILDTVKVIDSLLRTDTPVGPGWRRFTGDSYGETPDGDPFASTGEGRLWPLLTGERAHYELAAGNYKAAERLMKTMEAFSHQGLIPEQVWDKEDLPEKGLYKGRPTGSAMPLTWAQAEYIKLSVSLHEKKVFDTPAGTRRRYIEEEHPSHLLIWRFDRPVLTASAIGKTTLRLEVLSPALVRWSDDGWQQVHEESTTDTGLGIHYADLPLKGKDTMLFTFFWIMAAHWEGRNFQVGMDQL